MDGPAWKGERESVDLAIQALRNEARRKELIKHWEKAIEDTMGIGGFRIGEYSSALRALKDCEVEK